MRNIFLLKERRSVPSYWSALIMLQMTAIFQRYLWNGVRVGVRKSSRVRTPHSNLLAINVSSHFNFVIAIQEKDVFKCIDIPPVAIYLYETCVIRCNNKSLKKPLANVICSYIEGNHYKENVVRPRRRLHSCDMNARQRLYDYDIRCVCARWLFETCYVTMLYISWIFSLFFFFFYR